MRGSRRRGLNLPHRHPLGEHRLETLVRLCDDAEMTKTLSIAGYVRTAPVVLDRSPTRRIPWAPT
jgi:hypothetical protein